MASASSKLPTGMSGKIESIKEHAELAVSAAELKRDDVAAEHVVEYDGDSRAVAAISGAFNTLAVAAITLMVVVFVVGMIADSMTMDSESEFYESFNTITETTGDALNLAAVALIVLVASLILFLVAGFGNRGGMAGGGRM